MEKQRTMGNEEPEDADLGAEVEQAGIVGAGNGVGDVDAVVGAAGNADTATMDAIEDQGASSDGPAAGGCDQRFDEVDDEGRGGGRASGIAAVAMAAIAVGGLAWLLSTQPLAPAPTAGSGSAMGSAAGPAMGSPAPAAEPEAGPVRVAVRLRAEGWEPSAGAFELAVFGADGREASRRMAMPEGNGGMAAADAIEMLPEAQFDAARESYSDGGSVSEAPVLELAPGDYEVEVASAPALPDGSSYALPGRVPLKVAAGSGAEVEILLERTAAPAAGGEDGQAAAADAGEAPQGQPAQQASDGGRPAAPAGSPAQGGGSSTGRPSPGGGSGGGGEGGHGAGGSGLRNTHF